MVSNVIVLIIPKEGKQDSEKGKFQKDKKRLILPIIVP
jgi:hypothetical protein